MPASAVMGAEQALRERFAEAIPAALGPEFASADPLLRRSDHADFQADLAMGLAKRAKMPPRLIAEKIVAALNIGDIASAIDVAGPGFINVVLRDEFIASLVPDASSIGKTKQPETVVVDYSHPNVAREMHVGHLRSTIIGDAVVRVLEARGHHVVLHNHIGDWGRQFGMLVEHLIDIGSDEAAQELSAGALMQFYTQANAKFESDPDFAQRARRRVVAFQSGDPASLRLWKLLVTESQRYFQSVYDRLGVRLTPDDVRGESAYNEMLPVIASELESRGIARVDAGALCAFPPGFTGRDGKPQPLIVRYSGGAYGYPATDLAAVKFRIEHERATRLLYFVDVGQRLHLEMVFAVAREAGWLPAGVRAEVAAFGNVLGADGKRFRTRRGGVLKLSDLLDEAVSRAAAVVAEKNPDLDAGERAKVAEAVGIGAVKYADLSSDRIKDYVFDFDQMLALQGNTAPYLQYAHARIRSILRKTSDAPGEPALGHAAERALALELTAFDDVVRSVEESLQPHKLCTYLYSVATAFSSFYEQCAVLGSPEQASRLALCTATAKTLEAGLGLLGIHAPERM